MPKGPSDRPHVRLFVLVIAATLVPLGGLLWLGWHLFEKDRQLAARQAHDRLEQSAEVLVAALQRTLAASEQRLVAGSDDWPEGAVALTIDQSGIRPSASMRLAYLPLPGSLPELPRHAFEAGEAQEFRPGGVPRAIAAYAALARSEDAPIRAGALLRLAP